MMTSDSVMEVWERASAKLRDLLNADTFDRWIAGIVPLRQENSTFYFGVSNDMFSLWLKNNYKDLIVESLTGVTGKRLDVVFESGHDPAPDASEETSDTPRAPRVTGKAKTPKSGAPSSAPQGYNQRFTFDSFVVGENNEFAHAACSAVAKAPGKAYNPLFVHGGTGLGKTHLLQAIGQEICSRRKRPRIEYISSEEFANSFINALRENALPKFRRYYRHVDTLLIDDVHFFNKGKEQLQEEFFHTFNALYNRHKQIVLTSDRPPHEIGGLEKRLVSRFEWGLTTEIQAPDFETRVAILRKKQAGNVVQIKDDVLFFIAERIKSNIRRLEGALVRLISYVSMTGGAVDVQKAEQLLRPILEEESIHSLTVEHIQRTVADYFDIRLADMTSKRRPKNIAVPRQLAMYLSRKLTDRSSPAIAETFNRNHATILHAENTVERRMKEDVEFRHTVGKLERMLKS